MKRNFVLGTILLIMSLSIPVLAQDLYDIENITTIELTFEASNWDYLLDVLYYEGNEERLLATAVINGVQFDSVGVRYKGNSSYNASNSKNPLNIKLDYVVSDREYDNFGTIKLSNVYKDPSFVREVLAYEIARDYMPAPLSNFAKVWINGSYIGLYSSSQDVDKYFAKMHFGEKNNSFFKGELTNDNPNNLVTVWGYNGSLPANYSAYYELESDDGWYDLVNFLDVFNNDTDNIEEVLNVDRHLWMLAFDNLLVNLDAPINFAHNYYLYQDNAGRFNPIIWDMNENFGGFSRLLTGSELSTTGMKQMNPYLNASSSYYPIVKNVLSNERYKKMYVAHMKTIIEDHFSDLTYRTRALELQDIIDTEVLNDPNKFYTYNNFISNVDNSVTTSGARPGMSESIIGLVQLMAGRVTYLNTHSDFTATAPSISDLSATEDVSIGEEINISCDVASADSVWLCYRYSENDIFTKLPMSNSGGTYSSSVDASSSKIQYYIYAENDYAASFYPTGAEYTLLEINIEGKLVINEFMADNETYITDANGDNDDWIELYNNSANSINLSGYYLSDETSDLQQWAFPEMTLQPYSYVIVWADNDTDDSELHANFKLSASGEAIYLSDASGTIIDEIIFGAQSDDVSMGRYENGIGDFQYMTPSFNSENLSPTSSLDDNSGLIPHEFGLEANYPNPFNPSTTIVFNLPEGSEISLNIYNAAGKLVDTILNGNYCANGLYEIQWNAGSFASGVYIAVLNNGTQRSTQKMILMK